MRIEHHRMQRRALDQPQRFPPGSGNDGLHTLRLEQPAEGFVPPFLFSWKQHSEPGCVIRLNHTKTPRIGSACNYPY